MNSKEKLVTNGMLIITALLWGSALSFRKMALEYMNAFFFNGARFFVSFIVIFSAYLISEKLKSGKSQRLPAHPDGNPSAGPGQGLPAHPELKPISWQIKSGILIGTFFNLGSSFQQLGLLTSEAGRGGFISTLYIFFIPLISRVVLGKRISAKIWLGCSVAVVGLFFISMGNDFNIILGDVFFLITAVFYAIQVILIGRCVIHSNPLFLVSIQLATCAVMSMLLAALFERGNTPEGLILAMFPILYTGVLSLGVANLLQFIAQKKANPSVAGLIMSLESVFGAGFAAVLLHERMNPLQLSGCGLIFLAILISQVEKRKTNRQTLRPAAMERD